MSKATHIIKQPSLYLRVNGKLQQMAVGSEVTLTNAQAKGLEKKGFVEKISKKKAEEKKSKEDKK